MKITLFLLSAAMPFDESALQQCRSLTDNFARLACYDRLLPVHGSAADNASSMNPGVGSGVARNVPSTEVAQTTSRPSISESTTTVQPAKAAEQFGFEQKIAETQLETIESRIPGVFRGWQPKSRIQLENGQVWQVADSSTGVYSLDNPKVRIERGFFGTFFLKIEGANKSPKVKRLQ